MNREDKVVYKMQVLYLIAQYIEICSDQPTYIAR
jgi:hypothetical protein